MPGTLTIALAVVAAVVAGDPALPPVSTGTVAQRYGTLPLAFERNVGQTDPRVQFLSRGRGYTLFLTGTDTVLATATSAIRTRFAGAARDAVVTALDELPGLTHYYTGNDPKGWTTNVRSYARVRYAQLYPGIDVVFYGNQSQVEYDFLVAPGADPARILLDVDGAERLEVDARGHLVVQVAGDRIEWKAPIAYQNVAGVRKNVPVRYALRRNHRVRLELGSYDRRLPLVIDPVLVYSTYLGGGSDDPTLGVGADASGNVYVTGTTGSPDFPATTGPAPSSFNQSMFVTSLNPAGSALRYSALFAASSGRAIAVDSSGNAYVTGATFYNSFPTTPGAYRTLGQAQVPTPHDGVVVKLAPDGTIAYSTYLEPGPEGIAIDPAGNAYISGSTFCCGSVINFVSGWVAKLSATGSARPYFVRLATSTGSVQINPTTVPGITVDATGTAYVTGSTKSFTLQTTPGAYQPALNATSNIGFLTLPDAFVVKIGSGGTILYATYLGTPAAEEGAGITIDQAGNAFVAGYTYPTNPGGVGLGPATDVFVATLNAAGSALLSSRVFGGSQEDVVSGLAQDAAGNKYLAGRTKSTDFPTTSAARQAQLTGGSDGFLTKLSPDGSTTLYSSYFGGSGGERVNAAAVDARGNVYITGSTTSADMPVTPAAFQPALQGPGDAFIAKMRLTTSSATAGNFDGDGKADVAVYRPSNRVWYVQSSADPTGGFVIGWGGSADLPVPGDYDGDGRTDLAVYRPSTAGWFVLPSAPGYTPASFFSASFGFPGDTPVPGDYDGDGTTDLAVYHRSTGVWSYRASGTPGNPTIAFALGRGGDVPVPGDYDGDGRSDLAIYRPATGTWTFRRSSAGNMTSQTIAWGLPNDVPVPGDYDGDGVTDLAVYRPANGVWYVLKSIGNYSTSLSLQWGLDGDVPAPADYDGDGADDPTVYRPSIGTWFVLQSGSGYTSSQTVGFGLSGDIPVAAAIQSHAVSAAASSAPTSMQANQTRLADFDGDGRSDLTVVRPSQGLWYTRFSRNGEATTRVVGQPTDRPVFGDFDGDGTADVAAFRDSTGTWSIRLPTGGITTTREVSLGASGDIPAPADYDGDSRADVAVFRPSTGQWLIKWSGSDYATLTTLSWGLAGDVPVPADYDGDGLADLAVFRPVTGEWFVLESHAGYQTATTRSWGLNGDIAAPGDYDGDGTADLAVFRPANGGWYVLTSSTAFATGTFHSWGLAGDVPVPADFDGDGRTDLVVFRPANGTWYILKSNGGFATFDSSQWGLPGDVPVPRRP